MKGVVLSSLVPPVEETPPMMVRFCLPGPLRAMTDGRVQVEVETSGGTLQDALDALFAGHPALRDRLLTELGEIREHVNVFVGSSESRSTGGLATPLANGMEISVIPALSGG
jgi:sulfur-carrier protein